jgi:type II secretory pathway pseudopilin PulG
MNSFSHHRLTLAPGYRASAGNSSGLALMEVLVMTVVLLVAAGGSAQVLNSAGKMARSHQLQVALNENIESYIAQASALGDSYTCCSGTCTTTPPAASATQDGGDTTSSCATNNPRDDRYFFPFQDDPDTTAALFGLSTCTVGGFTNQACTREPDAVTEVCKPAIVNLLLGPLKTAIDGLNAPPNTRISSTIQPSKTIRVTITDITDTPNNRVARVFDLYPPMARFCT